MSKKLEDIAKELTEKHSTSKVNLIYAFNGSGKTRLSKEFQNLISPKNEEDISLGFKDKKIIYFSAFTEDLFFWNNDLEKDSTRTLNIQPNQFTDWIATQMINSLLNSMKTTLRLLFHLKEEMM